MLNLTLPIVYDPNKHTLMIPSSEVTNIGGHDYHLLSDLGSATQDQTVAVCVVDKVN
jgi:hypothetical protein